MSLSYDFDAFDDAALFDDDDSELPTTPWSLDELERSADLRAVRSAWAGCTEFHDF